MSNTRGDQAEMESEHQQQEQYDGQRHPYGERLYGAFRRATVAEHVIQRRAQTAQNDDDEKYDNDTHDDMRRSVTQPESPWRQSA